MSESPEEKIRSITGTLLNTAIEMQIHKLFLSAFRTSDFRTSRLPLQLIRIQHRVLAGVYLVGINGIIIANLNYPVAFVIGTPAATDM